MLQIIIILHFVLLLLKGVGRDSAVGIATRYVFDGPGIERRCSQDYPHPSRPALEFTQPPIQGVPFLSRGKATEEWR